MKVNNGTQSGLIDLPVRVIPGKSKEVEAFHITFVTFPKVTHGGVPLLIYNGLFCGSGSGLGRSGALADVIKGRG